MNEGLIDLHVHTTASDGTMSPRDIVIYAKETGLRAIAITDHDTIEGVEEALEVGRETGLEVVPGIEISVDFHCEMHILGYYIDIKDEGLIKALEVLGLHRQQRNPRIIKRLQQMGLDITFDEVAQEAGGNIIGRPHFAAVMQRKGYVETFNQAFERYLAIGKAAYVKKDKIKPKEGIEIITNAGGVAVLAHPKYLEMSHNNGFEKLLEELKGFGLSGMEVFYTSHTPEETGKFSGLAQRHGLLMTGGTDFHGKNRQEVMIGRGQGDLEVGYGLLQNLKNAAQKPVG